MVYKQSLMAIKGGKMREFKILKPYEFMGKKDIEEKAENILRRIQNTSNYQLNFP